MVQYGLKWSKMVQDSKMVKDAWSIGKNTFCKRTNVKKETLDHPPHFYGSIFFLCSFLFSLFNSMWPARQIVPDESRCYIPIFDGLVHFLSNIIHVIVYPGNCVHLCCRSSRQPFFFLSEATFSFKWKNLCLSVLDRVRKSPIRNSSIQLNNCKYLWNGCPHLFPSRKMLSNDSEPSKHMLGCDWYPKM